jgi:hypothetical protein
MAQLNVPTYKSRQFTWIPEMKQLVAEASDLSRGAFWSRIYDDACDVGFQIESHKTGSVVKFYMAEEHRAGEEVTHWTFRPLDSTCGCEVVVLND